MELSLQVEEPFAPLVDGEALEQVVRETLATCSVAEEVELGVLITNDETVRELNRHYRGLDETTDVLAFALSEAGGEPFPLPPGAPLQLGEVIISCPQARRQAQEAGHSLHREMGLLLVHGLLHLLGYDHEEPAQEAEMRSLEEAILDRVFP